MPLSIEDIVSKHKEIKIEMGSSYISSEQNDIINNKNLAIQTPNGTVVNIPLDIKYANQKTDTLIGSFGLKYGLTPKTEIYTRVSGLLERNSNNENKQTQSIS